MKTVISSLLLFAAVPLLAQDCAQKTSDACAAPKKALSPFLAASAAEPAAVKAAPAKPVPAPAAQTAPAAKTEGPAPAPAAQTAPAAASGGAASSPAWLLFVGAMLAGLYFYLGGGKKGKRK